MNIQSYGSEIRVLYGVGQTTAHSFRRTLTEIKRIMCAIGLPLDDGAEAA